MPRKKTLEARLADLIADFGLDAVIHCMRFAEEMHKPRILRRPRRSTDDKQLELAEKSK